ncbi:MULTISPECIES: glycoside hydrolase family 16 protein [Roseateles]|uniref:Glycoside hydrolase family 16 protein n=1 Tax=Roseateles albus TaxID=2987525 RepID=A0ABT5KH91_9BURK|nr:MULTISPECIES: glycoside hydrolase family 16 protein [Roseateles]MCV2361687.1 glycoside hydrolase family 16 protein [Paucibacter sp. TC2R-5]MDC8773273.1 glycoside hydrolase family 16 protein [Roseateles albus]
MSRLVLRGMLSLLAFWGAAAWAAPERFFDDFSYADNAAMQAKGWTPRNKAGHPGVEGATWSAAQFSLLDDPLSKGNRLLRLAASTDGSGAGTTQAQLCHARKYLEGTYAARIRFSDQPVAGIDGDPVIQTFYAVTPLKHDFDPEFSEMDWEYLPNGGWGSEKTRLYGIAWQTVQLNPWQAHNQQHEEFGSLDGWHQLMMQVAEGRVKLFLDGRQIATHGGRTYPVSPMSINFNLWFSPGGLLAKTEQPRRYEQDVDWVFHARNEVLSPAQVDAEVAKFRAAGVKQTDNVPAAKPALSSLCDF